MNCSFKQYCLLSQRYRSNIYSFTRVQSIKPRAHGAVAVYAKKHLETLQALLDNWTNIIDEVFKSYIKYCHCQQKQTHRSGHNQQQSLCSHCSRMDAPCAALWSDQTPTTLHSSWTTVKSVTYLYSAPQPLTKLILMVHILVSW